MQRTASSLVLLAVLGMGPTIELFPAWRTSDVADVIRCLRGPGQQVTQTVDVTVYGYLRRLERRGNTVRIEACSDDVIRLQHLSCAVFDYDRDGDVDLRDFAAWQAGNRR